MGVINVFFVFFLAVFGCVFLAGIYAAAWCFFDGLRIRARRRVCPMRPPANGEPYVRICGGLHADEYEPVE